MVNYDKTIDDNITHYRALQKAIIKSCQKSLGDIRSTELDQESQRQ